MDDRERKYQASKVFAVVLSEYHPYWKIEDYRYYNLDAGKIIATFQVTFHLTPEMVVEIEQNAKKHDVVTQVNEILEEHTECREVVVDGMGNVQPKVS